MTSWNHTNYSELVQRENIGYIKPMKVAEARARYPSNTTWTGWMMPDDTYLFILATLEGIALNLATDVRELQKEARKKEMTLIPLN